MSRFCTQCGASNDEDAGYCENCGASLKTRSVADTSGNAPWSQSVAARSNSRRTLATGVILLALLVAGGAGVLYFVNGPPSSNSEFSRAAEVINAGLASRPNCISVPVGVTILRPNPEQIALIEALKAKNLIAPGVVSESGLFGESTSHEGYIFAANRNLSSGKDRSRRLRE